LLKGKKKDDTQITARIGALLSFRFKKRRGRRPYKSPKGKEGEATHHLDEKDFFSQRATLKT